MALYSSEIFTAVEFGTSKIAAVHCRRDSAGKPEVIGFGSRPAQGSVVKGSIVDLEKAQAILTGVLADADRSSNGLCPRGSVCFLVSGSCIDSQEGIGTAMIYESEGKVSEQHLDDATRKAQSIPVDPSELDIDSFVSYYVLDSNRRVQDPVGYTASRLEVILHIITADRTSVETAKSLLRDQGFEGDMIPIFSGSAAAYGSLNSDEKKQGTLIMDLGAGTLDYFLVHNDGVCASGVLPVGMDNLANDISLGLDIGIEQARRLIIENAVDRAEDNGEGFIVLSEFKRSIPLSSFEKIIDARLMETFSIIRETLEKDDLLQLLRGGIVITGGGAAMPAVIRCAGSALGIHVRAGSPHSVSGAVTGLDDPRYAAMVGALNYVLEFTDFKSGSHMMNRIADKFENLTGNFLNKTKTWFTNI